MKSHKNTLLTLSLFLLLSSCNLFDKNTEQKTIARVNDSYLYINDIKGLTNNATSKQDSILRVNNYINQWATQQLLIDGAKFNLPIKQQQEYDKLVAEYKNDLYIKSYLDGLAKRSIDTTINTTELIQTYNKNIKAFKLNEELIRLRMIHVSNDNEILNQIKTKFKNYNANDKKFIDSLKIHYKTYSLNDSLWVAYNKVLTKLPKLTETQKKQLLKKSNFLQHKDSLGVYLVHINDVLNRNETAPLDYVLPTVKQIIFNKRKLEFIKNLEKDITKDAIKNNQFEIYN